MEKLKETIGANSASEVTREALTLLNWAVHEVEKGRIILSSDSKFQDMHKLVSPWMK